MKKLIFSTVIIILIVALAIFLFTDQRITDEQNADLTSTSETYKNEKYHFEFTYPNNWSIEEEVVEPSSHDEGMEFFVRLQSPIKNSQGESIARIVISKMRDKCVVKYPDWYQVTAYPNENSNTTYVGTTDPNWGKLHDPNWNRMNFSNKDRCISDKGFGISMLAGMDNSFETTKNDLEKIAETLLIK